MAKSLKDALTASMTAYLKSTILSTMPVVVESVIQIERDQMAQTSKQMADDFSKSTTKKLLAVERKELEIETERIKVFTLVFDKEVNLIKNVRVDLESNSDHMAKANDNLNSLLSIWITLLGKQLPPSDLL